MCLGSKTEEAELLLDGKIFKNTKEETISSFTIDKKLIS